MPNHIILNIQAVTTIIGIIIAAAIAYVTLHYINRRGVLTSYEKDNKILRDTVNDLNVRVQQLEDKVQKQENDYMVLSTQFTETKTKKNYLKQLVLEGITSQKSLAQELVAAMGIGETKGVKK